MPVACATGIITVNAGRGDRHFSGTAHRLGGVRPKRRGLAPGGGAAALTRRVAGDGEVGRCLDERPAITDWRSRDRVAGGGLIYSPTNMEVLVEYAESRQNVAKWNTPDRPHGSQCQCR